MKRKAESLSNDDRHQDLDFETVKRPLLDQNNLINYLSLPDGLLAHILSYCYAADDSFGYYKREYRSIHAKLRLVSQQFHRVLNDSMPCFAMLKLLKKEYERVTNNDEVPITTENEQQSPWFTPEEVKLIRSTQKLNLDEPLPSPRSMPLIALQIVATTAVCDVTWREFEEHSSRVELIYAVAGTGVFIQTINNEQSPLHGKQIIVQKVLKMEEGCPYLATRFMVTDAQTAKQLGVDINTPYEQKFIQIESEVSDHVLEQRFPQLDIPDYETIRESGQLWKNFTGPTFDQITKFDANTQYRRDKLLWNQFPSLPPAVYRVLTKPTYSDAQQLGNLINVIQYFKDNFIWKPYIGNTMRQFYSGSIEYHNIEHLLNDLTPEPPDESGNWVFRSSCAYGSIYLEPDPARDALERVAPSLTRQNRVNAPVPLTPVDFNRMLYIIGGGDPMAFGAPIQKFHQVPLVTEVLDTLECRVPEDAEIYTEFNEEKGTIVYYNAFLSRAVEKATLQLFQKQDKYWFRMQQWPNIGDYVEVMRSCELDVAKQLFEYWLGYWIHWQLPDAKV